MLFCAWWHATWEVVAQCNTAESHPVDECGRFQCSFIREALNCCTSTPSSSRLCAYPTCHQRLRCVLVLCTSMTYNSFCFLAYNEMGTQLLQCRIFLFKSDRLKALQSCMFVIRDLLQGYYAEIYLGSTNRVSAIKSNNDKYLLNQILRGELSKSYIFFSAPFTSTNVAKVVSIEDQPNHDDDLCLSKLKMFLCTVKLVVCCMLHDYRRPAVNIWS